MEIKTILGTIHPEKCYLCGCYLMPWQAKQNPIYGEIMCSDIAKCIKQVEKNASERKLP
jgi:hypothetical protein